MTRRISSTGSDSAPTALGAFLRGVERRGLVFAWLLAGSAGSGREALAWALERFALDASKTAFGDWPSRFWSLLLAAPALRRAPADPHWEPGFEWLSRIGHGPRAALLLRLVAGLAESDAAAVLGIARPTYRLGLQRALPRRADGSADVEAWQDLGRRARDLLRALPDDAASVPVPVPGRREARASGGRVPAGRGVRLALWLVALATIAGLGATFLGGDRMPDGLAEAPSGILVESLPAEPPAARYGAEDALALHPDLALLLDAGDGDRAAADPAFHAWLAAPAGTGAGLLDVMPGSVAAGEVAQGDAIDAAGFVEHATGRSAAEPLSAAQRLAALGPAERARLALRRDQWDALAAAERGEARERWMAWRALGPIERALLRDAAARFAGLDPGQQAGLRQQFDALDASLRHGWLLGPDLGADYGRLHPLIAQVPAEVRVPLLDALRGLDAQARDDLAVLAARTPPQSRAALRAGLLATPADERGRWLRQRVSTPLVDGGSR